MKKFIYAKQRGFISYQPSTGTQSFQVKGTGFDEGVFFDHTIADTADAQARFRVTVTSAAANTGNRGSDYTPNANTTEGQVTVLFDEALTIDGNNLVIKDITGTGASATRGYSIKDNDLIEITDCFKQDKGDMLFSLDRFLGVSKSSTSSSIVHFAAAEQSEADDTILLVYSSTNGIDSHRKICSFFDAAVNGSLANDDGFIEIDRGIGGVVPKELLDAGVVKMLVNAQA